MMLQVNEFITLLTLEGVSSIGILLAICALLVYSSFRKDKLYKELLNKYDHEQEENKKALIEIIKNNITATEQNTTAINSMIEMFTRR